MSLLTTAATPATEEETKTTAATSATEEATKPAATTAASTTTTIMVAFKIFVHVSIEIPV
ncbi:hypothetical protein [Brevibacillus sp. HB1.3]|uniref:hypothetical protein n=1 Tax=Brevibacillus sp. HB1.3 TaxID=2738842 RepID=UPI0020A6D405|nr:hypothetical protein [Brevibacillus sp. HB1.3]